MSNLDVPSPGLAPGLPDPSSARAPGGFDPSAIARMAAELFAAVPGRPAVGGVPVPTNPQPPGLSLPPGATGPATPAAVPFGAQPPGANLVPTSPQSPANAVASGPSLVPHAQAPNGVPDHALGAAPAYDGRLGSHAEGLPPGQVPRAPAASGPYYFLEGGGIPHAAPGRGGPLPAGPGG